MSGDELRLAPLPSDLAEALEEEREYLPADDAMADRVLNRVELTARTLGGGPIDSASSSDTGGSDAGPSDSGSGGVPQPDGGATGGAAGLAESGASGGTLAGLTVAAKMQVVGLTVGALVLGGVGGALYPRGDAPTEPSPPAAPTAPEPAPETSDAVEPRRMEPPLAPSPPSRVPTGYESRPGPEGSSQPTGRQEPRPAVVAGSLADERALIGAARSARDPRERLELLSRHLREFPAGGFAEEREVLWIQTLLQTGATEAGRRRADAFLLRYPESVHRRRVEALASETPPP